MTMTVIGSAVGPVPLGLAFDQTGSYSIALIILIVLCLAGVVSALMSPQPVHQARFKNDETYLD